MPPILNLVAVLLLVIARNEHGSASDGLMPSMCVDVRSYGAKGDGKTDDRPAIAQAMADAQAKGSGTTVYLPAGTYICGTSLSPGTGFVKYIDLPDGINLVGDGIDKTYLAVCVRFGSHQKISNMKIGKQYNHAVTNRADAAHTTLENCRFRGGGYIHKSGGTAATGQEAFQGWAVIQLGGNDTRNSLSHITFRNCEIERNLGDENYPQYLVKDAQGNRISYGWHGLNNVSLWENNRAGGAHIEYLTFEGCHFGVKRRAGSDPDCYGASAANVELKTNSWSKHPDFSHNWHNVVFRNCIFEKSWIFNVDLTDSSRDWADHNRAACGHEPSDGHGNYQAGDWPKIPLSATNAIHAGVETRNALLMEGCTIKGGGENPLKIWPYVICLENPVFCTVTDCTLYLGNKRDGDISASWECGPRRTTPIPTSGPLVYLTEGLNYFANLIVKPGFGPYTPSPYDPQ